MEQVIRVLIVDDSAYVRKVIKQMLSRSPFIEVVGTARDGTEALDLVQELKPDVITLDLIMPNMNGVEFLREQMQRHPIPVIIVSIASESGETALEALDAGAVDFVQKPTALATEKVFEISDELIQKVKAAARVKLSNLTTNIKHQTTATMAAKIPSGAIDIVVMGISTGGPQALSFLIPQLPEKFPIPVAVVLHMPVGYTEMYARRLNEISQLKVVEAQEKTPVTAGTVLIAPAGRHLTFIRQPDGTVITHLDARPFDTLHRPSVDVLFQSAAEVFGDRVLGVVMTGMGSDGKQGAAWIKSHGGLIFTESEESCVVYGMPRSIEEAGLSDKSIPLTQIAASIMGVL
ncbi:chemotaxis response regulator protein-glutamate methylesterase [[Phormidium ambiguum] IAM M-71]|uniref:Protein-glutamate methylesterase/protein-glutamine glutaminase n=1 Tax=[Phormidium ambiguum] IAM M-71 TaxID=454136 RepID=A0A1U7IHK4_9CYAN|nr:chemotaxis response regulator protein-glutamate methylesterase [Phormidium ambiguum]OKH36618.1 chemotaxis response regulator protein-glutamate methylesterase [Phormidium ambiguum IAM M-71]